MKKLSLLILFLYASCAYAQVKVQDLTEDTSPSATADIGYSIKNYATSPSGRKVKWGNITKLSGWQDDGTVVRPVTTSDNVAIGTTAASTKLTVAGTVTATAFLGDGSGLSGITGSGSSPGGSTTELQYRGGVQTLSAVSGSSVDSNGNVGLGSATPGTKLDVTGTIRASSDIKIGANSVCQSTGTNCPSAGSETDPVVKALTGIIKSNGSTISAVTAPSGTIVGTTDSQALTNKTIAGGSNTISGITEAMQSTSDLTTLDVSTSKHGYAPKAPNDATKYLDGTGSYSVPAGGGGSSQFTTLGSNIYFNTGNEGLGTVVPASKLTVVGNVGIGTGANTAYVNTAAPLGGAIIQGNVGIGTFVPSVQLDVRGGPVKIWTGSGTDSQATSAGELYVQGDLEVDGNAYISNLDTATTLNSKQICLQDGTNCPAAAGNGWTNTGTNIYNTTVTNNVGIGTSTSTATLEILKTSSTDLFRASASIGSGGNYVIIKNGGNVGIGSTNPGTVLDVNGQTRSTSLSLNGTAGITQFANANGMGFDPANATYTTPVLTLIGSNVGIGTSTAASLLEVGSTGQFKIVSTGAITGAGITNTTYTGSGILNNTTNVGINSTTPGFYLDVHGTGNKDIRMIDSSSGGAVITANYDSGAAANSGDRLGGIGYAGAYDNTHTIPGNSASVYGYADENWSGSARGSHLTFETTGNTTTSRNIALWISNGGNVGIGTLAPTAALQIGTDAAQVTVATIACIGTGNCIGKCTGTISGDSCTTCTCLVK